MDWRIAKRILSLPLLFPESSRLLSLIAKEAVLRAVQTEANKALEQMIWLLPTTFTSLAKRTLQILKDCFNNKASNDLLSQAIIVGRFDKHKFDLKHSLILGEDGGLYLLLNRLTKEQQKDMILENIVTETYLKDKIKPNLTKLEEEEAKTKELGDRILLGQGGFGKVKFALSLFGGKASPGDVVCIKKTQNFQKLNSKNEMTASALREITEGTIEDYFASSIADKVYAPRIFDLAIVTTRDPNEVSLSHQKGYLMMEVFPQNTATKVFREAKYQLWKYQKPFLQDLMLATLELLKEKIAFTDLKPDNALFDPDTFKTTIIDLGGTVKINTNDSLDSFNKTKYSFQFTEGYCAPEMKNDQEIINVAKALSYACGKVMEEVVQSTDCNQPELNELIDKLTRPNPEQRITIEEALKRLKEMRDDTKHEDILLNQYIGKIKGRIVNNRSSISLNEDILITKKFYIDLKVTLKNPEKYKNQKIEDLFQCIDLFLEQKQNQQQVMVIFGPAGSGKSIALQIKFIEAIDKWEKGQPLPIYFNLANGVDLRTIINSMNIELGTNLKLQELKNDVHLYIDSFDEGLEIENKREMLIKEFMAELKNSNPKILITCRSDYLESDSNHSWFTPQLDAFNKLMIRYVVPMSYLGENDSSAEEQKKKLSPYEQFLKAHQSTLKTLALKKEEGVIDADTAVKIESEARSVLLTKYQIKDPSLEEREIEEDDYEDAENVPDQRLKEYADRYGSGWKRNVVLYLKRENKKINQKTLKETLDKMAALNIDTLLDTGLMFNIVMQVLPELLRDGSQSRSRSKQDIYHKYVTKYQQDKLKKLTEEQKTQVAEYTKFISQSQGIEFTLINAINSLGKYLAVQLHLRDKSRLEQDAHIFQAMGYEGTIHFKKQVLWHLLKLLPLKIETKHSNNLYKVKIQEVKLGFIHSTIKNSYLLGAIQDEMLKQNGNSEILSSKSIVSDMELVKFIADAAFHDEVLKNYLRKAIDLTKSDKKEKAAIYAANCITILVSARHSFRCQDLSNINIKGSSLKNGIFSGVDFTGADLSYTILRNMQADSATFRKANLVGAKVGILPDLEDHSEAVTSVSFSADGRYLASGSEDRTVKIRDVANQKSLVTFRDHTDAILSVCFSNDGKYLASSSRDRTIKIWELETQKCLGTLQGHTEVVWSVSFSGDGKYLASGSLDRTVKIWELETQECLATLQGHIHEIISVSFSVDGKYVASGSPDKTVMIWEVQTEKCLVAFRGHTDRVLGVSFSRDGKYLASGSWDKTVKVWEMETRKCFVTLEGHTEGVVCVSFSGDGKYLASGSSDNTIKIWEVQTQECLVTLQGHKNLIRSVSFSGDGKYLASGSWDKTVKIWDLSESPSNLIALGGHFNESCSVSFSGNGKYLASSSKYSTVKIWEVQTNQCLTTLRGHTDHVLSMSFSGDGKYLASGSLDKTVKIWKVQTQECLVTLKGHTDKVWSVSFSGDGKYVASGSSDKTVKIWEVTTQECLATLQGHTDEVWSVSFSGDGKHLASGSSDKTVKIWGITAQKCLGTLQGHTDQVLGVSFSVDGKLVASGSKDKTVKIWDAKTEKCLVVFDYKDAVSTVSFSGDGKYLASGSYNSTATIWEILENKSFNLVGHSNSIITVSFSGDGKYFASNSKDGAVKIWSNSSGKWLLDRQLSDTELLLSMRETVIEETAVSIQTQQVFKQRGAIIKQNKIITDSVTEKEHNPTFALEAADKLNTKLLDTQIKAYKELDRQKLVQIHIPALLKQTEQNKNNEVLILGAKSDNIQAPISSEELQPQIKSGEGNKFESKKRKQACCLLF